MSTGLDVLEFDGEPFDALAHTAPTVPTPVVPNELPARNPVAASVSAPVPEGAPRWGQDLRAAIVRAHAQAVRAQSALQRRLLAGALAPGKPSNAPDLSTESILPVEQEAWFKPLARTAVRSLDAAELARLMSGGIAEVFGPAYDRPDCRVRLASGHAPVLDRVSDIELRGGPARQGRVHARTSGLADSAAMVAAAGQAAEVFALYAGLSLCFADCELQVAHGGGAPAPVAGPVDLVLDVISLDLVPRPRLRSRAEFHSGGKIVAALDEVTVSVVECGDLPVGPERGGRPMRFLGRYSPLGHRVMLSEFHLAHLARGDQGVAFGPEFAHYTGNKATRVPNGGLLLVDRVVSVDGTRGELGGTSTHDTEYDSPADSWYYADTANASMPNCVYMETSLQAALLLGYYLGATLPSPDAMVSLRNLSGTATVLREVDLRDTTIEQHSTLLSTTLVTGASLQNFSYTLAVGDEAFYEGETLFGYFSDEALANQTGLDGGKFVPCWIEQQEPTPATRTIDIAAKRAEGGSEPRSRGCLALLDAVDVVDGGGRYGKGYLHAVREIDPDDWFFPRHFAYDPVIPGSLGVETVIQAMQEWVLDSGLGEELRAPGFVLPVGLPFSWKYRGQFLPTDGECTLEVHIKDVQHRQGRVRVIAEASMWKPGLRIYEMTDVAVELREEGAPPWS